MAMPRKRGKLFTETRLVEQGSEERILLIFNPISGTMEARGSLYTIVEGLSVDGAVVTVALTRYRGHAAQLAAKAAGEGFSRVVCCGGDGTFNEVISGMAQSGNPLPIGYIPAGSTNDFAVSMGIPTRIRDATQAVAHSKGFTMDIGQMDGAHYFTYIASFGAFTSVSYSVPQNVKNSIGHAAYVLGGIRAFPGILPYHVRVEANGETYEDDYVFVGVANSTSVGGIARLNPKLVDVCDGKFEVILVRTPKNLIEFNRILRGLTTSDYQKNDMYRFFQASEIVFHLPQPLAWSLDGEKVESGETVRIVNCPRGLTLLK